MEIMNNFQKTINLKAISIPLVKAVMSKWFSMQSERDLNLYTVVQKKSHGQNINTNLEDIHKPNPKKIIFNTTEKNI